MVDFIYITKNNTRLQAVKIMKTTDGRNYDKIMKILQIVSFVFMAVMLVTMLILVKKFNISVENAYELSSYIKGGTLTVALIIIAFTAIKSFTLVFPLAVIFAVSGLLFGLTRNDFRLKVPMSCSPLQGQGFRLPGTAGFWRTRRRGSERISASVVC